MDEDRRPGFHWLVWPLAPVWIVVGSVRLGGLCHRRGAGVGGTGKAELTGVVGSRQVWTARVWTPPSVQVGVML